MQLRHIHRPQICALYHKFVFFYLFIFLWSLWMWECHLVFNAVSRFCLVLKVKMWLWCRNFHHFLNQYKQCDISCPQGCKGEEEQVGVRAVFPCPCSNRPKYLSNISWALKWSLITKTSLNLPVTYFRDGNIPQLREWKYECDSHKTVSDITEIGVKWGSAGINQESVTFMFDCCHAD